MGELIVPRNPVAGAGIAVTFQGDTSNQAVYWEVVSVDPNTGVEYPGRGYLKWRRTRTDAAGLSINYYFGPPPGKGLVPRYDTGRLYDTPYVLYDDNPAFLNHLDRIRARAAPC